MGTILHTDTCVYTSIPGCMGGGSIPGGGIIPGGGRIPPPGLGTQNGSV